MLVVAACSGDTAWKTRIPLATERVTSEGLIEVTQLGIDPLARVPKARFHASFTTTTLPAGVAPDCVETLEGACVTRYCELPLPDAGARDSGVVRHSAGRIDFAAATLDGGIIGFVSTTAATQEFYLMRPVAEPDLWVFSTVGDVVPAIDRASLFTMAPIEVISPTCNEKNECDDLRLDRDLKVEWADGGTGKVQVTLETRTTGTEFITTLSVACTSLALDHTALVPKSILHRFEASTGTLSIEAGRTTRVSAGRYPVMFKSHVPAISGTVKFVP